MRPTLACLRDLLWQVATIAAVPAVIVLAMALRSISESSQPADVDDHAHTGPYCQYCVASRNPGLNAAPAPPGARPVALR